MMADPILRLSDEILVHIFNFVPFIDRSSLSNVCERFRIIIEDKNFHRNVDISYCYRLSSSSLWNLLASESCKNIHVLNLNGCYWIPAELMTHIKNLDNLKELHVLHCKVSLNSLLAIAKSMSLVRLSWTWIAESSDYLVVRNGSALTNIFGRLEELILHMNMNSSYFLGSPMIFLLMLLSYFANLQTLDVRNISYSNPHYTKRQQLHRTVDPDLKKLRSLKLDFGMHLNAAFKFLDVSNFCSRVLKSSTQGKNWLNWWIPDFLYGLDTAVEWKRLALSDLASARALFMNEGTNFNAEDVSESCEFICRKLGIHGELSEECIEFLANKFVNVEEIIMQMNSICSKKEISVLAMMSMRWKLVTHLDLIDCHIQYNCQDMCATLANMKALTHLSVSGCWIATSIKKRAIGLDALPVEDLAGLGLLTKECPLLQYLEISGSTCRGASLGAGFTDDRLDQNRCASPEDEDLNAIFQWKYLKSLTLKKLPKLSRCAFLIAVGKNCPLQTLRLKDVGGIVCTYNESLVTALRYCTNLLDFSMFQDCTNLDSLFTALLECSKLVRIAVVAGEGSRSYDAIGTGIAKMFTSRFCCTTCFLRDFSSGSLSFRWPNLLVFYLVVKASPQWCRDTQTHLYNNFLKDRPALSVMICSEAKVYVNEYPFYHIEEMLYF